LSSATSAIPVIDQQNTVGGELSGPSTSLGQSFTPTLNSIRIADFSLLTEGVASTLHLDLFAGAGYTGALLGASSPVTFTNTLLQTIEFTFPMSIALVPGNQYTIRLTLDSGDPYRAEFSSTNPYAGGTAFSDQGGAVAPVDLVFAEGIPEPSVTALLLLGCLGIAGACGRRFLARA
jgi:hypothetical protein